jgi:hypothetical protein
VELFPWAGVLWNYFPGLASNWDPPDLCLLSSYDYRHEPSMPGFYYAYRLLSFLRYPWSVVLSARQQDCVSSLGATVTSTGWLVGTIALCSKHIFPPQREITFTRSYAKSQVKWASLEIWILCNLLLHLTVLASSRVIYQCKLISWNLLNRMIFCSVACR